MYTHTHIYTLQIQIHVHVHTYIHITNTCIYVHITNTCTHIFTLQTHVHVHVHIVLYLYSMQARTVKQMILLVASLSWHFKLTCVLCSLVLIFPCQHGAVWLRIDVWTLSKPCRDVWSQQFRLPCYVYTIWDSSIVGRLQFDSKARCLGMCICLFPYKYTCTIAGWGKQETFDLMEIWGDKRYKENSKAIKKINWCTTRLVEMVRNPRHNIMWLHVHLWNQGIY